MVKDDDPDAHEMHAERFSLSQEAADAVNAAKREGRRVIAVGTTPTRLLEHAALLRDDPRARPSRRAKAGPTSSSAPVTAFAQ